MTSRRKLLANGLMLVLVAGACFGPIAPAGASFRANAVGSDVPNLNDLDFSTSEMRPVIERYVAEYPAFSRPRLSSWVRTRVPRLSS